MSGQVGSTTFLTNKELCWTTCQGIAGCNGAEWHSTSETCNFVGLGEDSEKDNDAGWESIRACEPGMTP